ncbi:MAG TPA: class I SAM-dependent methyltransferase [Flavipsychrobacter sp.]|mgnify:CR=1 FL=1|nr:class I SAM-dependent methyltransferase [Flavipsychrobacter sp.]
MNAKNLVQQALLENEKVYDTDMSNSYRNYDEEFVHTKAYEHIAGKIKELTQSFPYQISVLDVGCGTGRYFHILQNLKELTGIDVSGNMLQKAKKPFRRADIPLEDIKLIEGNFYDYDFGNKKFDFIYSIGVLGEHTVFDKHVCRKLRSLLNYSGKIFFSVVDIEPRKNTKRKLAEAAYPLMPKSMKQIFDKRWQTCYMTYKQLDDIVKTERFSSYEIDRYVSEDPLWEGVHLECTAYR